MTDLSTALSSWLDKFAFPLNDPGSRLFILNVLSSLVLVGLWDLLRPKRDKKSFLRRLRRHIFNKGYWFNSSTFVDYQSYLLNSVLKVLLFLPFLDFSFAVSGKTVQVLNALFDAPAHWVASTPLLLAFSLLSFVFDDLCRFAHHLMMHKVPFLWSLHKVHHSATVLTPFTLYRIHPLEAAMATVRNSLSWGISLGVFMFSFNSDFQFVSLFGVNMFAFLFNLMGSNLRHSHIQMSFGFLEKIFISPLQHQIHHSSDPRHFDKNFGVSLSIWDALIGSRMYSPRKKQQLRFGVSELRP